MFKSNDRPTLNNPPEVYTKLYKITIRQEVEYFNKPKHLLSKHQMMKLFFFFLFSFVETEGQ
jgi:hypothetical protein